MKKNDILSLLAALAVPAALMAVGGILILAPDTGAILLSQFLGWALSLAGAFVLLWAIFTRQWWKLLLWLVFTGAGSFLLTRPLALAAFIGRILGGLLVIQSLREFLRSVSTPGRLLSGALILVGITLFFAPMSASRLVFASCGIALVVCGGLQLLQRLREHRYLPGGRDDIIDAL